MNGMNSRPERVGYAVIALPFLLFASICRSDEAQGAATLSHGKALFEAQCAICHGDAGDGQGKFAYLMSPRPRNFLAGKFKLATTENQIPSDADLLATIRRGMPGSAMPPWDHLPVADLGALTAYVRQLHADAVKADTEEQVKAGDLTPEQAAESIAERTGPGSPLRVPPEAPFDNLRWFEGRKTYIQACASCHGLDGHPVAEAVKFDDDGYPDPPRSFVSGIFKGGSEGNQLYARIIKGMRGTPMPAFEGTVSDIGAWDLIHYVQSLAKPGAQERAQMRREAIVATNHPGGLPEDPLDSVWDHARPVYVALAPLWWTENRIEGLIVQALHDESEVAIRLSWLDPTVDDRAVKTQEFRDAVAIQFSLASDPPFYMGGPGKHGGVNMWMWKADRSANLAKGYQDVDSAYPDRAVDSYPEQAYKSIGKPIGEEWPHGEIGQHEKKFITAWGAGNLVASPELKTPVESLVARGPGSLSGLAFKHQLVQGNAQYKDGVWYVQMKRALTVPAEEGKEQERVFRPGDYIPVSFATWNGDAHDRDGKKNISIWQRLVIE